MTASFHSTLIFTLRPTPNQTSVSQFKLLIFGVLPLAPTFYPSLTSSPTLLISLFLAFPLSSLPWATQACPCPSLSQLSKLIRYLSFSFADSRKRREAGELVIAENATVWEFTPYEFGSWAFGSQYKSPGAFTPIEYLGTSVDDGSPNGTCWKGFDQLS